MAGHDVFGIVVGLLGATAFLIIAIKCLRSGESGPQINIPEVSARRTTHPGLYWMFLASYASIVGMCASIALFFATDKGPNPSLVTLSAALAGLLFFGMSFALFAVANGIYTLYGFRSGKAIFVYMRVSIDEREQSPRTFWSTQISNIFMVVVCGVIGLGSLFAAIWIGWSLQ